MCEGMKMECIAVCLTSHEQADDAHGECYHHDDRQLGKEKSLIKHTGHRKTYQWIVLSPSYCQKLPVFGIMQWGGPNSFIHSVVAQEQIDGVLQ